MHSQPSNVAAGKKYRGDHEGVRSKCQASAADRDHCLVIELVQNGISECRQKDLVDQIGSELATAAMPQHNLRMLKDRQRARPKPGGRYRFVAGFSSSLADV